MNSSSEKDIEQLNAFLKGELAAVETYRKCIEKIDDPLIETQLRQLMQSHEERTRLLAQKVLWLGGAPLRSSGAWGAFAKLVEGGAALLGKSAAISTLEEGENLGRKQYSREVSELSPAVRAFVEHDIMPEQRRTREALAALQKRV